MLRKALLGPIWSNNLQFGEFLKIPMSITYLGPKHKAHSCWGAELRKLNERSGHCLVDNSIGFWWTWGMIVEFSFDIIEFHEILLNLVKHYWNIIEFGEAILKYYWIWFWSHRISWSITDILLNFVERPEFWWRQENISCPVQRSAWS